jgi:hypothetical protein
MFQDILVSAQQEQSENLQKRKGKALGKFQKGEPLSEEEWGAFTPTEVAALQKAYHPQAKGGVTAQMVPPEISSKIGEILANSQGMSSDELKNVMDNTGIPPIYSNGYIENRRRMEERGGEHDIKFHQESSEFDKKIREHAETARKQIPLIENSIKSVSEGQIKPSSLANVFSFFGEKGKKISNALLSGKQAALVGAIPEFLEGRKELFGVRLSDADLKILQDKLPDIGKSNAANLAILNLMKKAAERSLKLEKVSRNVLEEKGIPYRGGKLRPLGYEGQVMRAFDDLVTNEGTFEEMPAPQEHTGRVIEDENGLRFRSNGQYWEQI